MTAYEYIMKMKDQVSSKMKTIAKAAGFGETKMEAYQHRTEKASGSTSKLGGIVKKLGGIFAGAFAIRSIISFNNLLFQASINADKLMTSLSNAFNSSLIGRAASDMLDSFTHAFQKNDLASGLVKLVNDGFKPTRKEMVLLGDFATKNQKKFQNYSDAFIAAQDGQFGALKDFGVQMQITGNTITASYNGQETQIKKTNKSIRDYLLSLGESKNVVGKMQAMANGVEGTLNRMQASATNLRQKWGADMSILYIAITDNLGKAMDWLKSNVDLSGFAEGVVKVFRIMKPPIMALGRSFYNVWLAIKPLFGSIIGLTDSISIASGVTSLFSNIINGVAFVIEVLVTGITTLMPLIKIWAGWQAVLAVKTGIMIVQQWALNVALTANPIGIVVVAVAALVGGIVMAFEKVEWFRGAVLGIWEVLKGLGTMIKDYVVVRFEELLGAIGGIGKAIWAFVKGDWEGAWKHAKEAGKDLIGVDSKKQMFEQAKGLGAKFGEGYKKGVSEAKINKALAEETKVPELGGSKVPDYASLIGGSNGAGGNDDESMDGLSGITGGGSKQTNITVNFENLIKNSEIKATTINEGIEEIEDKLINALLRVLNSSNQMQTS